ncbi:hypothetical protein CHU_1168 [Cytophaga hutchinsonii ATCC 33406]|uniref:Uncharacterized protein n=1 Tax=Cytophaga hutchinsonii (strain ATCC 33406 / DSM 1761 / CIP 103989 / NBRC 15051 / NCIMB 9469 / D465) TaxID=269798 RepID=A0A6N4SQ85_CYTH3|nr:hypothetical protein CHU_1168 [Cytophaga hutchinsonii ATCC 33406]
MRITRASPTICMKLPIFIMFYLIRNHYSLTSFITVKAASFVKRTKYIPGGKADTSVVVRAPVTVSFFRVIPSGLIISSCVNTCVPVFSIDTVPVAGLG